MSTKPIVRIGDPLLLRKCRPVEEFNTPELHALVNDMWATMHALHAAGIAAPQIGVDLRVVVFFVNKNPRYPTAEPVPETVLINPTVEILDPTTDSLFEGCLSVPGLRGEVARPKKIRYTGYDAMGNFFERTVTDFHARVVQHEVDHLDGVLFPMRVKDFSRFGFIPELEAAGIIPKVSKDDPDD